MNEVTVETFEVSVKYKFHIRQLTWSDGEVGYDWWEETTEASADEWFDTYEAAYRDMYFKNKEVAHLDLGLDF